MRERVSEVAKGRGWPDERYIEGICSPTDLSRGSAEVSPVEFNLLRIIAEQVERLSRELLISNSLCLSGQKFRLKRVNDETYDIISAEFAQSNYTEESEVYLIKRSRWGLLTGVADIVEAEAMEYNQNPSQRTLEAFAFKNSFVDGDENPFRPVRLEKSLTFSFVTTFKNQIFHKQIFTIEEEPEPFLGKYEFDLTEPRIRFFQEPSLSKLNIHTFQDFPYEIAKERAVTKLDLQLMHTVARDIITVFPSFS